MEEITDSELVAQARCGNKEAFGQLIERYQSVARRVALGMVRHEEVARELVQEAFLEAWLSLDHLREAGRFKSWLYGVVLNVCRSYIREQKAPVFSLDGLEAERHFNALHFYEAMPDPQEIAEERELHRRVLEAVKILSPQNRTATLLFYYQQLSLQEIAAILGISVTAVKGRLHKARHQLREQLLPDYPEVAMTTQTQKEKRRKTMLKVTIVDVVKQDVPDKGMHTAVVLVDEAGRRAFPIWVGPYEGEAIAIGLREFATPRPMTFNFMAQLLAAAGATLEEVRIQSLKDDTFYAVAKIRSGDKVQELDARPSDAISLALRTGSPIYAAEEIVEKTGTMLPAEYTSASPGKGLDNLIKEMADKYQALKVDVLRRPVEELDKSQEELIRFVFGGEN